VLAGLVTQLDDLDGLGQLLSKEWADGDIIQQKIATVSLNVCPLVTLNKLPTLHRSETGLLLSMTHQPKVSLL